MTLQEFLLIEPKQKFRPKDLWKPGEGLFSESRVGSNKPSLILSGAKWKSVPSEIGKPYSICVRMNRKGRVVFQYDPLFMSRLMEFPYWFKNTIMHELMHVLLGHITYRRPERVDLRKWNIACDLAINSILSNGPKSPEQVPDFVLLPGRGVYRELAHFLSAEAYYEAIKNWKLPRDPEHKLNNRIHQKREQVFVETTRAQFEDARDDLFRKVGNGTLPGAYNSYVFVNKNEASIGPVPEIEALLLKITELKRTEFTSTRRVRNRRYPEYPGKRVEREPEPLVLLVDWSESVKAETMEKMDRFIKRINQNFPVIYVPFTTDAIWDSAKTYATNSFRNSDRIFNGGTCIDSSLGSVYSKFPRLDQIIVVVSDFNDTKPVSLVKKNVYGVYTDTFSHHINDHSEFHGKIFKI